jgi:signal transduction histidine kinase
VTVTATMIHRALGERMGRGTQRSLRLYRRNMADIACRHVSSRLVALVIALSVVATGIAQAPAILGLTLHDPDAAVLNGVVWVSIGIVWVALAILSRSVATLWRLPSALFRAGLAVGAAAIVVGRVASLIQQGAAPATLISALEAGLYGLGVVALASLAAFASSRSLLRPSLVGTRPPLGARDIALRTRILVATTGASFATAGILLSVLIDFDTTPAGQLAGFLGTAAALVVSSALIGWLVGEDTARGVEEVTRRMRELAHAGGAARSEVPVVAADEIGDLVVAVSELEQRIRQEESAAERGRIARELHDGIAKSVSVLSLEIASLASRAPDEMRPRLERVEHLARLLAEELRAIVQEFRTRDEPEPFDDVLRRAVGAHLGATMEIEGEIDRVGGLMRFEILRVLEEAVRNAALHAHASRVRARLGVDAHAVRLTVEDDGVGVGAIPWSDLATRGHFGLLGMRERAALLEGQLRIEERERGGTLVTLDVPLNGSAR